MMPRSTWMSLALAGSLFGCAARGDVEVLETENRQQEDLISALEGRLDETRSQLEVARKESATLHAQLQSRGEQSLLTEQVAVLHKVSKISFHRLLTSGLDMDGQPGDEGLSVMLMPLDDQGDLVKLPGAVEFDLLDLSLPADQQNIGHWTFTLKDAEIHWQRGFLSAGYLFHLPWQGRPVASEVTLHGRFIVPDGRKFEATSQVKIEPPKVGAKQTARRQLRPRAQPLELPEDTLSADGAIIPAAASEPAKPVRNARPVTLKSKFVTPAIVGPKRDAIPAEGKATVNSDGPREASRPSDEKSRRQPISITGPAVPATKPVPAPARLPADKSSQPAIAPSIPPYGEGSEDDKPETNSQPAVIETSDSFPFDDLPVRR